MPGERRNRDNKLIYNREWLDPLRYDATGRIYVDYRDKQTGKRKRKTFGSRARTDPLKAYYEYQQWKMKHEGTPLDPIRIRSFVPESVARDIMRSPNRDEIEQSPEGQLHGLKKNLGDYEVLFPRDEPPDAFAELAGVTDPTVPLLDVPLSEFRKKALFGWARNYLYSDLQGFAEGVGIPALKYLDLRSIPQQKPLKEIYADYLAALRARRLDQRHKVQCDIAWSDFRNAVGVENVADIRQSHVDAYHAYLLDHFNRKGEGRWSASTIGAFLTLVRAILNRSARNEDPQTSICGRVVRMINKTIDLSALKKEDTRRKARLGTKPRHKHKVTPDELKTLLSLCRRPYTPYGKLWQALLNTAANTGYYLDELATMPFTAYTQDPLVEGGKPTPWRIDTYRNKTVIRRICALWPETIEAIQAWREQAGDKVVLDSDGARLFFYTPSGKPMGYHNFIQAFSRIRAHDASVDGTEIRHFRYTLRTIAADGGCPVEAIRVVMGQVPGERTDGQYYIENYPAVVRVADVMRKYYFGEPNSNTTQTTHVA